MSYDPERITFFATTDARGKYTPFGIKAKDRTRHVYVIGKTGMGKSTLLENMAVQDIRNGEGLAFIDPHGQTAEKLLDYIPEERKKDVLYFAPFDMEYPISFNVMEDVGPDKRHLVVSGLMSVFEKIWVDAWSARMAYILQNTLMALLEYPDSTLLGVNRMLSDKNYRQKVVDNIQDPSVKSFWVDEFAKYNERYMQEAGDAIKNKIGQFTANPLIRNIIGQPRSSFDIRKIMDDRKILIMNLSKGLVGETNANLLGSMLTTRIYLAAMSRADLPLEEMNRMPNFYFYVDEFQSFANSTFANILSEARKYKLNLTIAHQYIEQMEEEVKNAVFGNVGTVIAFRVGPFDAEVLETVFAPRFYAADICNLGFAQIYLTLMIDGIGSAPFSAVTLPPLEPGQISYKNIVLAESREQFASERPDVEKAINEWHEEGRAAPDVGKGKNSNRNPQSSNGSSERRPERTNNNGPSTDTRPSRPLREERAPREESTARAPQQERSEGRPKGRPSDDAAPRREKPQPRTDRQPPRSEVRLSELRNVLATISTNENGNGNSDKKKDEKQSTSKKDDRPAGQKNKSSDHTNDLKAALASVLHGADTTKKETAQSTPPQKQSEQPKKQAPPEPSSPQPRTERTDSSKQSAPQSDSIDAKKLERMMRVTTSDKTPLK